MDQNLLNIGFGNTVVANRIVAIISPNSAPMKRLKDEAKEEKRLVDATQGRKTRSMIVTDSNHVILSAIQFETISQRFESANASNIVDQSKKITCQPGKLFIISAPSGAGKTTLCQALLDRFHDLRYSVSYTTRKPRNGEKDGVDYHFISKEEFIRGIELDKWAEWAEVYGNYYGTSTELLEKTLASGHDILLDIDVQGMQKIIKKYPESITIFIMPPSMDELISRLKKRNSESDENYALRIASAEKEMACSHLYQHVVINDRLPRAGAELATIIQSYRHSNNRNG